ncbi:MAG: GTP cyclohydrolase FolE2 [Betaproteobacteria bacterium]
MNRPESPGIPDVQSDADLRALPIDRVGIRDLRYPIRFEDVTEAGEPATQSTIATFGVYVALPADRKGTHMSRLVAAIDETDAALSLAALPAWMSALLHRLEAGAGSVDIEFPWFMRKSAPVSGVGSMMDYTVRLAASADARGCDVTASIVVPVMSLCPSSKAISDYGAHNQRSHITIAVRPLRDVALSLAGLVRIGEEEASCELYGLLKRSDEKYVTERAYEQPRFVEDLVRGIAARLLKDPRLAGFRVSAENFESIHNHSAYAEIVRGTI